MAQLEAQHTMAAGAHAFEHARRPVAKSGLCATDLQGEAFRTFSATFRPLRSCALWTCASDAAPTGFCSAASISSSYIWGRSSISTGAMTSRGWGDALSVSSARASTNWCGTIASPAPPCNDARNCPALMYMPPCLRARSRHWPEYLVCSTSREAASADAAYSSFALLRTIIAVMARVIPSISGGDGGGGGGETISGAVGSGCGSGGASWRTGSSCEDRVAAFPREDFVR